MWLFFDESGDFGFPVGGQFDVYVQAALICPDSQLPVLDGFVERAQAGWCIDELHGTRLTDDQLVAICGFLAKQAVHLLALGTDTAIMNEDAILEHRLDQAARIKVT